MKAIDVIIDLFRPAVKDDLQPYLVTDADALRYLSEAHVEGARRAKLLVDSSSRVAVYSYPANNGTVKLDKRVIDVRRAKIRGRGNALAFRTVEEMDVGFPGWEDATASEPFIAIIDHTTDALVLWPPPASAGVLASTVTREPLISLLEEDDEIELADRYLPALVAWMRFRTFSSEDTDLFDAGKAQAALAEFEAEFGPKLSGRDERFNFENYHGVGEY